MHSLDLFCLTLFIEFGFSFSLLSTKVGVHVTGIVLRGRSLKMVKPAPRRRSSRAEPPSLGGSSPSLPPSCFDNLLIIDGRNTTSGLSFLKVSYFFGHKQALNKSNFFSITQKTVYGNIFDDVQHLKLAPPCSAEVLVNQLFTCCVFGPSAMRRRRLWWFSSSTCVGCVFPLSVTCLFGLCSCLPFSHELGITSLIICTKYEINENSEKVLHKKKKKRNQLPGLKKSEGN